MFDIDGTLLDMKGAGRRSFVTTLRDEFGWDDEIPYINFAGNTDLNVLQEVARHHGRELTREEQRRFFARLPAELDRSAAQAQLILYPGVRELLRALAADRRAVLALVTGNVEACAKVKLKQFDLHNHFVLGAFGDDHGDRNEIARLALRRVRESLEPGETIAASFLVGDTPFDIAGAKSIGAVSIGVATGKFDAESLRKAGADHVFTDLSDTAGILRLLGLAP